MKRSVFKILFVLTFSASTCANAQFWTQSKSDPGASQLAMADDGSVYYLSGENIVFKSEDDGSLNSWNQLTGYPVMNRYSVFTNSDDIFLVNYDPTTYGGRGVYKSEDGGQSWNQKNSGLGGDTNVVKILGLLNNVLLIQTQKDQNTKNLYRSTNGGDSWDFIRSIGGFTRSVTLTPNDELYLCTGLELFKSLDNGLTWSEINSNSSSGYHNITELDNGNLLLMSFIELLESSDGGNTFTTKSANGLPDLTSMSNVIYPQGEFYNDVIYMSFNNGHGIFKSEDDGDNWTNIDFNLPSVPNGNVYPDCLKLSKNGYLFASVAGVGVYRSISKVTDSNVGLTENKPGATEIRVFPNPTSDYVNIVLDGDIGDFRVELRDLQGKLIIKEYSEEIRENKIQLNGEPGIYLIKFYNDNFSYTEKVIKR